MTVPWYRLDPNECEKFVSILLLRQHRNGRRRRPSQGDGGIDVIIPLSDSPDAHAIYQIKYFHQTLNTSQREQIRRSSAALRGHIQETGLCVREWHLTMPLDPTENDERWLESLFAATGIKTFWKGESHLEGWAAKFPEVVDYYVNGGRERHDKLVSSALSLAGLQMGTANAGMDLDSAYKASAAMFAQINDYDPHYQYDLHLLNAATIDVHTVPSSAVVSYFRQIANGPLLRIDVRPKYNGAHEDSPVVGNVNIKIPSDQPELAEAIRKFEVFGDPVSIPAENARVSLTGPLDPMEDTAAEVQFLPSPPPSAVRVRLALRDPDGSNVATAFFRVASATEGISGQGHVARLVSDSGLIEFEHRANARTEDDAAVKGTFHVHWKESIAALVRDDMRFAREIRSPRRLLLAHEVVGGYTELADLDGIKNQLIPDWLLVYTECLAVVQEYCSVPLRLAAPDQSLSLVHDAIKLKSFLAGAPLVQSKPAWVVSTTDVDAFCSEVNQNGRLYFTTDFNPEVVGATFTVPNVTFSATGVTASPAIIDGARCAMLTSPDGLVAITAQRHPNSG